MGVSVPKTPKPVKKPGSRGGSSTKNVDTTAIPPYAK